MERYQWSRLTHLQVGRYAEYLVKMEFTMLGFDVYAAEVDGHGIDFVIRAGEDRYYDLQVKSIRGLNYVFFPKAKFILRANLLAAVVIFFDGKHPDLYLIPSLAWREPNALFADHDYRGKPSTPEYGLNLSQKNLPLLAQYRFHERAEELRA